MSERTLHEVLADVLDAGHRYPAMIEDLLHCLFDEFARLRDGLYRIETTSAPAEGSASSGVQLTVLVTKFWPTEWLLQFAHAVSRGVMPETMLPAAIGAESHEISRAGEGHEATLSTSAFMRIPEHLNTEFPL